MKIFDQIYGQYELPDYVEALAQTDLCTRARQLTQDSLPNFLLVQGPAPSRFDHGLGVAHLAELVVNNNPELERDRRELVVAALLHDAGNPPCSHLFEVLLEDLTGHRGESHLSVLMQGSVTEQVLRQLGIRVDFVLKLVAGNLKPLSDVLAGSLDIDNADNVARYKQYVGASKPQYGPEDFARLLRYGKEGWYLASGGEHLVPKWRSDRNIVYTLVNAPERSVARRMIFRAAELAYEEGLLSKEFFRLTDGQAIELLTTCSIVGVSYLANAAVAWEWYEEIFNYTAHEKIPSHLERLAKNWKEKRDLANTIAEACKLQPHQVCLSMGWGRHDRQVTLPIQTENGGYMYDEIPASDTFRFRVWMDSHAKIDASHVSRCIEALVGLKANYDLS